MAHPPMTLLKGTLDILILKTLGWAPSHGYAISRWIQQQTGDELHIEEGALYPALRRLEEKGLLTPPGRPQPPAGRPRSTPSPPPAAGSSRPR